MVRGDRIYNLRTARGYTLQELGDKIGVTASTVRKWESGVIETIRSDKINKLAKALDVTSGYLLDWTNKATPYEAAKTPEEEPDEELHDVEMIDRTVDDMVRGRSLSLGRRIFWARKSLRLTQEELGKRIDVTKGTINKYESGAVKNIKRPTIEALAKALETSPDFLLGKTDDAGRPLTLNDNASKAKTLQESMAGRQHPIDEMAYTATGNLDEVLEVNPEEENPHRRIITERQLHHFNRWSNPYRGLPVWVRLDGRIRPDQQISRKNEISHMTIKACFESFDFSFLSKQAFIVS